MSVLDDIVAATRVRIAHEPPPDVSAAHRAAEARPPHRFAAALRRDGVNVIAEIKAVSPSAGTIVENPDVESIARDYEEGGAAAISIVTEKDFFKGDRAWIAGVPRLPVIMKDFVVDEAQLVRGVAAGASAILLLASLLDATQIRHFIAVLDDFGCDALVEVHDEEELERATEARIIGVNNRNLRDFSVDLATAERLSKNIPNGAIKVAESGIKTRGDVERLRAAGFHAFLVGESLLRQNDRAAAVRALTGKSACPTQP
jgi:indole-3-glycerol phosphate synthase